VLKTVKNNNIILNIKFNVSLARQILFANSIDPDLMAAFEAL